MKQYVFIVGTGRCGTKSMVQLLNNQKNITAKHETIPMPWDVDMKLLCANIAQMGLEETSIVAESASYFLPYTDHIIDVIPSVKFVCITRDKDDVVESFNKKSTNRNHWTDQKCFKHLWTNRGFAVDDKWDKCFPKFPIADKKEAIGMYWELYHRLSDYYQWLYPQNFKKFPISVLNNEQIMAKMFRFIGVNDPNLTLNICANRGMMNTSKQIIQVKSEVTIDSLNRNQYMKKVLGNK